MQLFCIFSLLTATNGTNVVEIYYHNKQNKQMMHESNDKSECDKMPSVVN